MHELSLFPLLFFFIEGSPTAGARFIESSPGKKKGRDKKVILLPKECFESFVLLLGHRYKRQLVSMNYFILDEDIMQPSPLPRLLESNAEKKGRGRNIIPSLERILR